MKMLEYFKTILEKVSFDRRLFEKELRKAIEMLLPDELYDLKKWCYEKFSYIYADILNRNFAFLTA